MLKRKTKRLLKDLDMKKSIDIMDVISVYEINFLKID